MRVEVSVGADHALTAALRQKQHTLGRHEFIWGGCSVLLSIPTWGKPRPRRFIRSGISIRSFQAKLLPFYHVIPHTPRLQSTWG
jgi:hypothetical protein